MKKRIFKRILIPALMLIMAFQLAGVAFADSATPIRWNADGGTYTARMTVNNYYDMCSPFTQFYSDHFYGCDTDYITATYNSAKVCNATGNLFAVYALAFQAQAQQMGISQSQTYYVNANQTFHIPQAFPDGTYCLAAVFATKGVYETVTFTDGDVIDFVYRNTITYAPVTGINTYTFFEIR